MSTDSKPNVQYPPGPSLSEYGWMYLKEGCNFLRLAKRLVRKYGDIVHVRINLQHHFYINQPELIEKILLAGDKIWASRPRPMKHALGKGLITSQGDLHGLMRRFMQPYFQKQAVTGHAGIINQEIKHILGLWQDGQTRDLFKDMTRFALGVINQVVFGTSIKDDTMLNKIEHAAHIIHHYGHQSVGSHINMHLEEIPFIGKFTNSARARRFMDGIIYRQIEDHRSKGNYDGNDLLSVLLKIQQTPEGSQSLSDTQIRDELMTMFFAGHETTASGLSWTFYLLSQHPDVEEKLHGELDRVLNGRTPALEDVPNLRYTRMVLCESMRLYPPVWTLGRRPPRGVTNLYIEGYQVPNKSMILISPYLIHHDERFFPDPERFDPERFTPEEEAKRHRFAYFPFGGGNRKCIGEPLAWLESMLALATIASRWRLRLFPGHHVEMEPLISLKPKYGMRMILERRTLQPVPALSGADFKEGTTP